MTKDYIFASQLAKHIFEIKGILKNMFSNNLENQKYKVVISSKNFVNSYRSSSLFTTLNFLLIPCCKFATVVGIYITYIMVAFSLLQVCGLKF